MMIKYSILQEKRDILLKGIEDMCRLHEYKCVSLDDLEVHSDRIDLCLGLYKYEGYSYTLRLEMTFKELLLIDESNVDLYLSELTSGLKSGTLY